MDVPKDNAQACAIRRDRKGCVSFDLVEGEKSIIGGGRSAVDGVEGGALQVHRSPVGGSLTEMKIGGF